MRPLGKRQIKFLAGMAGIGRAVLVGDTLIRSLEKRGMFVALAPGISGQGSFFTITPNGLRAVADAMDAGIIPTPTIDDFKAKARGA